MTEVEIRKALGDLTAACAALIDAVKYAHRGDALTMGDKLRAAESKVLKVSEVLGR